MARAGAAAYYTIGLPDEYDDGDEEGTNKLHQQSLSQGSNDLLIILFSEMIKVI